MGDPDGSNVPSSTTECIGRGGQRRELKHLSTSRKEKKNLDFPSSGERKGTSLNRTCVSSCALHVRGRGSFRVRTRTHHGVTKVGSRRTTRTTSTVEGESPVVQGLDSPGSFPSKIRPVEAGLNSGGPPPKAKYSLVTDSAKVARAKDEKNPNKGSQRT